ncbi:CHAP domain-containing protein [Staphylococcus hominis]|uniref:CHAP domain-containing protein n=1 Tax=Staphylococcus hominis TaxID=1290 RepID=UPI003015A1D9
MKKIATVTIATAGIATVGFAHHDAHAAENNGYNPNDPTSYSYSYTIDQQGNYHYTWQGNWSPDRLNHTNDSNHSQSSYNNYNNNSYNYNSNYSYTTNNNQTSTNNNQSYTTNNTTGGLGANTASTSDSNVKVTTQSAPRTQSTASTQAFSGKTNSGANYYTWGQCTYYVYDKVGGTIGNTWGNANNWANAAAQSGYTVNNTPKAGAVMQTTQGGYGHVAYVESVNSDGSVTVSEMNYQGVGVVSTRTISASQASSYNYIS